MNEWFIRENPIKMDDLEGFPIFLETPMFFFPVAKRVECQGTCHVGESKVFIERHSFI